MKRNFFIISLLVFLSACGSSSPSTDIRAINAISGSSLATVRLNDSVIVDNLRYGETSSSFSITDGGGVASLYVSESAVPVAHDTVSFAANFEYLLFFAGELGKTSVINKLVDQISAADGNFRIRFSNLAPNGKSLDFYLLFPGQSVASATPLNERIGIFHFTDYFEAEQGTYSIVATERKTQNVVFETGLIDFSGNRSRTFALLNAQQGPGKFQYALIVE